MLVKPELHSWGFKPSTGNTENILPKFSTPKESDSFFSHSPRVDRHSVLSVCLSSGLRSVNTGAVHTGSVYQQVLKEARSINSTAIAGPVQRDAKNNDFGSSINILNTWLCIMFSVMYGRKHSDEVSLANVNLKGRGHSGELGIEKEVHIKADCGTTVVIFCN